MKEARNLEVSIAAASEAFDMAEWSDISLYYSCTSTTHLPGLSMRLNGQTYRFITYVHLQHTYLVF